MSTHSNPANSHAVSSFGAAPAGVTVEAPCEEDGFEGFTFVTFLWALGGTIGGCTIGFFLDLYVLFPLANHLMS